MQKLHQQQPENPTEVQESPNKVDLEEHTEVKEEDEVVAGGEEEREEQQEEMVAEEKPFEPEGRKCVI